MSKQGHASEPETDWPCPWCHQTRGFEAIFEVADDLRDYDDVFDAGLAVYKCRHCHRVNAAYFTAEYTLDRAKEPVQYWQEQSHLPPRLDCGIHAYLILAQLEEEGNELSWMLHSYVKEALKAYDAGCYTLAALGARRAIEYHLQATGFNGPLERAIIEAEKVWGPLFKHTAEEIREWGNAAAHDTKPFNRVEAQTGIKLLVHYLGFHYGPASESQLLRKRSKRTYEDRQRRPRTEG